MRAPKDAEFKRFIALGQKIAKRMRKSGVEMTFDINFGPVKKRPAPQHSGEQT